MPLFVADPALDATKRSPELRAQRIAQMVELLEAGVKDYHAAQ